MLRPRDSYVVLRSTVPQAGDGSNSNPDSGHALSPMSGAMQADVFAFALQFLSEAATASRGQSALLSRLPKKSTAIPSAINVAATIDTSLIYWLDNSRSTRAT